MDFDDTLQQDPLPDVLLKELDTYGREVTFLPGSRIYHRGDKPKGFLLILEGQVSLRRFMIDGSETLVDLFYPGQWMGALSFLDRIVRPQDAIASTETKINILSAPRFQSFLDQEREVERYFYREYCKWLRILQEDIEMMTLYSAPQRLARKLLRLSSTSAYRVKVAGTKASKRQPVLITQEELGLMVGLSRRSVGALMRQWSEKGLIDYRYGQLKEINDEALADYLRHSINGASD